MAVSTKESTQTSDADATAEQERQAKMRERAHLVKEHLEEQAREQEKEKLQNLKDTHPDVQQNQQRLKEEQPNDLWGQNSPQSKPEHASANSPVNNANNTNNNQNSSVLNNLNNGLNAANTANQVIHNPQQAAANAAGQLRDRAINMALDKAGESLAAETGGLSIIAAKILKNKKARRVLLIMALLPILFFLIFIMMIFGGGGLTINQTNQQNNNQQTSVILTITKSAPGSVPNGTNFDYNISYAYPGSAQNLTITDTLPDNVNYVSSPAKVTYDNTTRILTWKLSDNLPLPAGGSYSSSDLTGSFSFTVKPTTNDTYVYNLGATGTLEGASPNGGNTSSGSTGATANDCNGAYKSIIAQNINIGIFEHKTTPNFGDPKCSLTNYSQYATNPQALDNLYQKIKDALAQTNSPATDINTWKSIIPCESSYDANNFLAGSTSSYGAYGLFQMNPQYVPDTTGNPKIDPTTKQPIVAGNTQYDRGDVDWETQVTNAINQNKISQCKWTYWQCAPSSLTISCTH